jgi:6-pyruvoyltetrahydropterin/6-carboxytetrahydropterin synthase
MSKLTVSRYHDISCGHRVAGHESKCRHLHGHNYRITFTCEAEALDALGRVIDFSEIKSKLCEWLESNWDHRFLVFADDPLRKKLEAVDSDSIVAVPFNPTAENMADFLLRMVGPSLLYETQVRLARVEVEETRKCSASASLSV